MNQAPAKGRVLMVSLHLGKSYSGGRYCSWIFAEALASRGYEVTVWTNERPLVSRDFEEYPDHGRIQLEISKNFQELPKGPFDLVFMVPHRSAPLAPGEELYWQSLRVAARDGARYVFLNFETPNWFNSMSPVKQDESLWDIWLEMARHSDMILSISAEGNKYAREFYKKIGPRAQFEFCHPPVNSRVADRTRVEADPRQMLCISRALTGDSAHKGFTEIEHALSSATQGCTLTIVVGKGGFHSDASERLERKASSLGMKIRWLECLPDDEKYKEIKKSRMMLFLSFFEGYGYPPVEAAYCGIPCVAYDLPVLREACGGFLRTAPVGDHEALRERVAGVLKEDGKTEIPSVSSRIRMEGCAEHLDQLLSGLMKQEPVILKARISERESWNQKLREIRWARWKRWFFRKWGLAGLAAGIMEQADLLETIPFVG